MALRRHAGRACAVRRREGRRAGALGPAHPPGARAAARLPGAVLGEAGGTAAEAPPDFAWRAVRIQVQAALLWSVFTQD